MSRVSASLVRILTLAMMLCAVPCLALAAGDDLSGLVVPVQYGGYKSSNTYTTSNGNVRSSTTYNSSGGYTTKDTYKLPGGGTQTDTYKYGPSGNVNSSSTYRAPTTGYGSGKRGY